MRKVITMLLLAVAVNANAQTIMTPDGTIVICTPFGTILICN
jgi:hypothetical protein